jgi:murein DD-endopeptidase MepM/ murein hydrolase activator NlpD
MSKPRPLCYNYIMKITPKIILIIFLLAISGGVYVYAKNIKKEEVGEKISKENVQSIVKEDEVKKSEVKIEPKTIYPGDPVFITIISSSTPKEISWGTKKLKIFEYEGLSRAFVPVDFSDTKSSYELKVSLEDGREISQNIEITPREKIERPLGIPEKLGGNTDASAQNLVKKLAEENHILNTVATATSTLWSLSFKYPLKNVYITDDYGYDRKTITQTIPHKGTDFRASIGTPVMAMNDGVVRVARVFTVYGNTVIIDHGLGVQTLYMHLSKLNVKEGDFVKSGDVIGQSGDTGYADAAHLHISVKIDGISIDPITFLNFFKN